MNQFVDMVLVNISKYKTNISRVWFKVEDNAPKILEKAFSSVLKAKDEKLSFVRIKLMEV